MSALFHKLQTSPPVFVSCQDSLSYLASAETVSDLLLPAETGVRGKRLSAGSHFLRTVVMEGTKRLPIVSEEAKYDRQPPQEEKTGRLVCSLCALPTCYPFLIHHFMVSSPEMVEM